MTLLLYILSLPDVSAFLELEIMDKISDMKFQGFLTDETLGIKILVCNNDAMAATVYYSAEVVGTLTEVNKY